MAARIAVIPFALLLPLLAAAGCGDSPDRSGDAVVTDSAGIRIVQNPLADFGSGGVEWTVGEVPEISIGDSSGDEAYLFDRAMGMERLTDGRWVVADMGSGQIRWYDPDGAHAGTAGRPGEGPGEFRQVMGLVRLAGDTLLVDDGRMRWHRLDEEGAFVGEFALAGSPVGERTDPFGVFDDGTVVAMTQSAFPQRLTAPHSTSLAVHRATLEHDDGGRLRLQVVDTIGRWDVLNLVPGWNETSQRIRFEDRRRVALMSDGLVVADPMRFEVRMISSDGELRTVSRFEWEPDPVTDAHIETKREEYIHQAGEGGGPVAPQLIQQRTEIADSWRFADHLPAFSDLLVDRTDHIWLREYVPNEPRVGSWFPVPLGPSRWLILSPDGGVVGRTETPARFRPRVIGEDFVAGVYLDEMEIEYLHAYPLDRR